jgi:hypothetical protein
MLSKDYSLSKKDGWEEYKQKTWILLPKLFNSSLLSYLFYAVFSIVSFTVYSNGGIEASLKLI